VQGRRTGAGGEIEGLCLPEILISEYRLVGLHVSISGRSLATTQAKHTAVSDLRHRGRPGEEVTDNTFHSGDLFPR